MMDLNKLQMKFKKMNRTVLIIAATSALTVSVLLVCSALIAKPNESLMSKNIAQPKTVSENDLNQVQITEDAYRKLGIQTAALKRERVTATKTYAGELVIPTGEKVTVTAPIAGKLVFAQKNGLTHALQPGAQVKAGEVLYFIQPLLTPDARVNMLSALADAESLVNTTKAQLEAADIALVRAKKLLDELVGSQRNVDEANANYQFVLKNLDAAKTKRDVLDQVVNIGTIAPMEIKAPQSGIISNILAVSDQLVSSGNPIIEISKLDTLWVRAPVPAGELDEVNLLADAKITPLSVSANAIPLTAKPVKTPPSADPLTGTVHVFYAVANQQAHLSPAQRVTVTLSTRKNLQDVIQKPTQNSTEHSNQDAMTVPWSSIVFDVYGGSWVYAQTSQTIYARKRVFLERVNGATAVISQGPEIGTQVVTNGALELFGIETGFAH